MRGTEFHTFPISWAWLGKMVSPQWLRKCQFCPLDGYGFFDYGSDDLIKTTEDAYLADKETGEATFIPKGSVIRTKQEQERDVRYAVMRQERETQNKETSVMKDKTCGDFFWSLYRVGEEYHPDVPDTLLVKIIYLLTYLDYDSNSLVVRDAANTKYRPMTKADVKNLIQLHRSKFDSFWTQMLETGIIKEDSGGKLVVDSSFCKGSLSKSDKRGQAAIKIFTHAVRYLYENTDVRSHKYLAYFYRLIPYINLRHNILCSNPLEGDKSEIRKITIKDVCHILGIDESHQSRLKDSLFKLRFIDKNGDNRSVITVMTNYKNDEKRDFILINPQFYSGYIPKNDLLTEIEMFAADRLEVRKDNV